MQWLNGSRCQQCSLTSDGGLDGHLVVGGVNAMLHQLHVVEELAVCLGPRDSLPIPLFDILPEKLDAVEVWSVGSVEDEGDVGILGFTGAPDQGALVDWSIVHEHRQLLVPGRHPATCGDRTQHNRWCSVASHLLAGASSADVVLEDVADAATLADHATANGIPFLTRLRII